MTEEKEKELYEKYPKIFGQKDLPMTQTCMCWGITCSDGWYDLIDTLCRLIQSHIDHKQLPQVEAVQVKEKYGGLRFYVNHADPYVDALIDMAESMSYNTCEYCGNKGKPNSEGWITTLCDPCRKEDEAMRAARWGTSQKSET